MKMNFKKSILLLIVLFMSGCVTESATRGNIPYIDYSKFTSTSNTLQVKEITSREETTWDTPKIENKDFREALISTLKKAGIFREAFTDSIGDYQLESEIISQKVLPGLTASALLFVRYRLIETNTNEPVWEENIFSQYDTFGGNRIDAINGAVRDNLTQLLKKLSDILNQQK